MIRVDIETIIMSNAPVPSVIVLRERGKQASSDVPKRALSIQTGAFEAAAVGQGIDHSENSRPITQDLMIDVIDKLGGKLERVEIDRVDAPVFFATLVINPGVNKKEVKIDARPSDALSLAVRANAPIYVEDDVMNRAGSLGFSAPDEGENEVEIAKFDEFVQTLSPDDF